MKNEEKAKELADYYAGETDYKETAAYDAAHAMAEWKDEQFENEKQSIIEEAIGWIDYNNRNGGCNFDGWEKDFKQAVKGE